MRRFTIANTIIFRNSYTTILGSQGSADTVRDVRGFAVKFYTEEAIKFPDLIHVYVF